MKKNKTTPLLSQAIFLGWHSHAWLWQGKFKAAQFPTRPLSMWAVLCGGFSLGMCCRVLCLHWHFVCLFNIRMRCHTKMIWTPLLTNITYHLTGQEVGLPSYFAKKKCKHKSTTILPPNCDSHSASFR